MTKQEFENLVGPLTAFNFVKVDNVANKTYKNLYIGNRSTAIADCYNWNNVVFENCMFENIVGRALSLWGMNNITYKNCFVKSAGAGFYNSTGGGIYVMNCRFENITGPANPLGQSVQLNGVNGGSVLRTQTYNPVSSQESLGAEDVINLYNTSNIMIDSNYINGGGQSNSGGGINIGDGGGNNNIAQNNVLINPGQYGIAIVAGNGNKLINNKLFGKQQSFTNAGVIFWNGTNIPIGSNNEIRGNHSYFKNAQGTDTSFWTDGRYDSTNVITGNVWGPTAQVSETMPPPAGSGIISVVTPPVNKPPLVNAGSDLTITLPTNSATLQGTATDDGSVSKTEWSKAGVIVGPGLTLQVTGLTEGTHVYRLTATDNQGATSFDEMTITVKPAVVRQAKKIITTKTTKVYDQLGAEMQTVNSSETIDL